MDPKDNSAGLIDPPLASEGTRYDSMFAVRTHYKEDSFAPEGRGMACTGGWPDLAALSTERYVHLVNRIADTSTAQVLQYGPTEGLDSVISCIGAVMAEEHTYIDPSEVLVTSGGQQVIDLACKALINPGDTIITEAPTYPGALQAFRMYQANIVQVDIDDDGILIDQLEDTLERLETDGIVPKFIYTVPNFQNPSGVTLSLERRRRLIEVVRDRGLLILEDNPFGLLRYRGEALPTLYSIDASHNLADPSSDHVIYLGTFSKIFWPGLRVGWTVAPPPVLQKLILGKQGADLCTSPMAQLLLAEYFAECDWRADIERLKHLYGHRNDAMAAALHKHFGEDESWKMPDGGFFAWVTVANCFDAGELATHDLGLEIMPGSLAYVDGLKGSFSMRLNFAGATPRHIERGVGRLAQLLRPKHSHIDSSHVVHCAPTSNGASAMAAA
jgi:2-aminoadipate transaminase